MFKQCKIGMPAKELGKRNTMGESHFANGNRFDDVEGSELLNQRLLIQSAGCSASEAAYEVRVTAGALLQQMDERVTRLCSHRLHLGALRVSSRRWRIESLFNQDFLHLVINFIPSFDGIHVNLFNQRLFNWYWSNVFILVSFENDIYSNFNSITL